VLYFHRAEVPLLPRLTTDEAGGFSRVSGHAPRPARARPQKSLAIKPADPIHSGVK